MEQKNKSIDKLIVKTLKKQGKEEDPVLSTYELAKRVGVSWSTTNIHCFKLKTEGEIQGEDVRANLGVGKKTIWWL